MDTTVEYLAAQPDEARAKLEAIRQLVHEVAPEAEEALAYGVPTFRLKPTAKKKNNMVHFAAFKDHVGVYPRTAGVESALGVRLKPYAHGKGTLQFGLNSPLPLDLLREVIEVLYAEAQERLT
mgnify:CR=1 FL=1